MPEHLRRHIILWIDIDAFSGKNCSPFGPGHEGLSRVIKILLYKSHCNQYALSFFILLSDPINLKKSFQRV